MAVSPFSKGALGKGFDQLSVVSVNYLRHFLGYREGKQDKGQHGSGYPNAPWASNFSVPTWRRRPAIKRFRATRQVRNCLKTCFLFLLFFNEIRTTKGNIKKASHQTTSLPFLTATRKHEPKRRLRNRLCRPFKITSRAHQSPRATQPGLCRPDAVLLL